MVATVSKKHAAEQIGKLSAYDHRATKYKDQDRVIFGIMNEVSVSL